jgi:acyl-coenzyme A thioesterase PaaI-like protein
MVSRPLAVIHHELCFGCGTANLFGLQLELERQPDGSVAGRFFVKQDHQGPPGVAHGGVLAAALDEAAALAAGDGPKAPRAARLEVDFHSMAAVGSFVRLRAWVEPDQDDERWVTAAALGEGDVEVATARALLIPQVG